MAMDDLYKALQLFQNGVQQYAITGAVNDANAQMMQLNQAAIDEGQKRQQLQQLANQTALRLTGVGATGTQIQSAFTAINPQNFGSVEQMQLEGELSGNQQLRGVASDILGQREANKQKQMLFENKMQMALLDKKFQQDLFLKQLEVGKKNADLKPADVSFQTNISMANKLLDNLEGAVNEAGTWEAGNVPLISNKKAAAVLDAAPYQLAITYAKIVDPESVAREGEVSAAQKYMLDLGMFSSKEKVLEGLRNMRSTINEYQKTRGNVKSGSAAAPAASGGATKVRILPGGSTVRVQQQADGSWKEIP